MSELVVLIALFNLKHFLADFPLQSKYMLGKSSLDRKVWMPALGAHAGVHAAFTAAIVSLWVVTGQAHLSVSGVIAIAGVDFWTHFAIDRVKASPRLLGRWKPSESQFWVALGADQLAHATVHLAIAWAIAATT